MNDKPPSTPGSGQTGVFKRVMRAIKGEPWSREEIQDLLKEADNVIDPQEHNMLTGVFEVSETQVREVMVPRSQMIVIEKDQSVDEMLTTIIDSGHSRFPVIGEDRDCRGAFATLAEIDFVAGNRNHWQPRSSPSSRQSLSVVLQSALGAF